MTRDDIAIKFSLLRLVSSFWISGHVFLSYAIHFWVYLSQCEMERTDPSSQNHNIVQLAINYSGRKAPSLKMQMFFFSPSSTSNFSRLRSTVLMLIGSRLWWSCCLLVLITCGLSTWADDAMEIAKEEMWTTEVWFGSMDCLFERSYHLQMHTPTAVDPH